MGAIGSPLLSATACLVLHDSLANPHPPRYRDGNLIYKIEFEIGRLDSVIGAGKMLDGRPVFFPSFVEMRGGGEREWINGLV